ncbi:glycosyltransferase [Rossellomorea vietnamensis]|uniref:glycosyltransferase n=1 Tax=Rossellomorea vietnamensis TaxID=218284 RepID=UPI001CCE12C3|nr:glycosyltransferase [Rossellomorea vietnamensis]MCA0150377.1 glycosyltransferase [Rossellomorea vietnamensis]
MRVLQINSVCGIGSTGRIATDIHAVLKEQDYQSYIAYGRDTPMNCDKAIRIGTKLDNYLHVAKTRILDMHGFGSKKATKDFIERIKKINPDVIHLHNIHGYFINIEILFEYLKEANLPVVWTLHDCWAFTAHCAYFEYSGCDCWKLEGENKCIQKRSYPGSLLVNNSKNNFKRKKKAFTGVENLIIITPSEWLANLVKKSFLREYPVEVINNGIDLNVFKPTGSHFRKNNKLENKFIILGVASTWDKRKGLNYFIELSNSIKNDEVIVLVGLSEKQKDNLPKNIIGITRTNNVKELVEIYSSADVFVNPTIEDNFPTTNLEALASGTPVITFDTGGSAESLDEHCGFKVEKGNTNELLLKIKKIKENNKAAYKIPCVNRARNLYDKTDRFKEYVNLYLDNRR